MSKYLPIDDIIPDILNKLVEYSSLVVQAPPGSGKTTRIPIALLNSSWLSNNKIVLIEPRRLAATNASRWMANCLGEVVGKMVGYRIRFEQKVSPATRIEVVTEGVFLRQMQMDPLLQGVGIVIFDEFHERNLASDLALAICCDIQAILRKELRLLVMSATIDTAPITHLLGGCPVIRVDGKSFPVTINYLKREEKGEIPQIVARGVRDALQMTSGDILAFLPGTKEIRHSQRLLAYDDTVRRAVDITPLYGDLPFAAQERAIQPGKRRKLILATNIAETSLTIEGVSVVIDSGWCRQMRFNPATGLNSLATTRISSASATQRAGRAGRLGPGVCFRLWTEYQQGALIASPPPEILTADLSPMLLAMANLGINTPSRLTWLDAPPDTAIVEAHRLLKLLEAIDCHGRITSLGRSMATLPLHPRLAKMLIHAKNINQGLLACDLAAILAERDILSGMAENNARVKSRSDLADRLEYLENWRQGFYRNDIHGPLDHHACRIVERIVSQLRQLIGIGKDNVQFDVGIIGLLLAIAYPDRLAQQREPGSKRYLLSNGRGVQLSSRSAVYDEPLLVAVNCVDGEGVDALIHSASALSQIDLCREFASVLVKVRCVAWDERQRRVVASEELRYGALVLESRQIKPSVLELHAALMKGIARHGGIAVFNWSASALEFKSRVGFLSQYCMDEGWPDLSDTRLAETLNEWLLPWLDGIRSLAEVSRFDILPALKALLTWEQTCRLDEGAPTHIIVPSGSKIHLNYTLGAPPVLAVKLQELFGLAITPTVAWGKVPVILHLLSPAGRPIQITQDLRNFWDTIYPEVKKELKGRYPKHPWPDNPWDALPTRHLKKKPV